MNYLPAELIMNGGISKEILCIRSLVPSFMIIFLCFKADRLSWRKKITDDNLELFSPSTEIQQDLSILFYAVTKIYTIRLHIRYTYLASFTGSILILKFHTYIALKVLSYSFQQSVHTNDTTFWRTASLKSYTCTEMPQESKCIFLWQLIKITWQMFKHRNLSILYFSIGVFLRNRSFDECEQNCQLE